MIQEEIEKQKILQPGNCVAFGSAFKVPVFAHVEKPDPEPLSQNVDVAKVWKTRVAEPTVNINVSNIDVQQSIPDVSTVMMEPVANQQAPTNTIPNPNDVVDGSSNGSSHVSSVFRNTQ